MPALQTILCPNVCPGTNHQGHIVPLFRRVLELAALNQGRRDLSQREKNEGRTEAGKTAVLQPPVSVSLLIAGR